MTEAYKHTRTLDYLNSCSRTQIAGKESFPLCAVECSDGYRVLARVRPINVAEDPIDGDGIHGTNVRYQFFL